MRFQEIRGFRCARRHLGRGPHGSLTALLGPSGSGKSTLLRAIPGLEKQDSGEIFVFEEENTQVPPQKRGVGFVFQHYAAFKPMTVFENVAFGLKIRKRKKAEIRKRVHELLELVQLEAFADRYPAQLSGGQRQRMALARALAIEPQILLLDEPFGALDARVRQELRAWLRRLYEEIEVTTVLATHDQEEAMELDGRVVLMNHGRIEQVGEPQDLYENPANEFVMSFVGPANKLGDTFVRPHDIEIQTNPNGSTSEATVDHPVHLGFEVHVEMTLKDGSRLWAQITREGARRLGLDQDKTVHVRIDHTTVFDKPWEVRSPSPDKT